MTADEEQTGNGIGRREVGALSVLKSTFSFCLPLAPHRRYVLITLLWSRVSKGFSFLIKNIHKLLQVTCEFICLEKNPTLPKLTTPLIRPLVSTSCPWGNYWHLLVWCLFMHLSRSRRTHTYTDLSYVQGLIMHSVHNYCLPSYSMSCRYSHQYVWTCCILVRDWSRLCVFIIYFSVVQHLRSF